MFCPKCNYLFEDTEKNCPKCGSIPPDFKNPPRIEARLQTLKLAVKALKERQITAGEFIERLDLMEQHIRNQRSDILSIEIPDDMQEEIREERETGLLGIDTFLEALDSLRAWANGREPALLGEGLRKAEKATDLLNKALSLNFQSFNTLVESMYEFIRLGGHNG